MRPRAAACERNRGPILAVLRQELRGTQVLLEVGSGTGEHAVYFGEKMPAVTWQTSDLAESHAGINEWRKWAGLDNVLAPLLLDMRAYSNVEPDSYSAVFSSNTSHIMDMAGVRGLFSLAGKVLRKGGSLILYGPFRQDGQFTGPSDEAFHASLRARSPAMGIRDLEELDALAAAAGLARHALYAMPANNWVVVWKRGDT